ncbi:hypothetical protein Pmar_PMAR001197 [Perkinsus marinus ATCC 50983]|uniref:Uncharacterized protein n=1 Tax=Perkinsus marinus (strain ATCC 50983 / TXsc) TaxID=423536 RepID=C5KT49_PERM5|nr:hypothetical protein Pmar_PMAR001197 [Perkinsus marinus ATCC 50983]EER12399.1 hypothetical protein Pmar_PMAR001197 [Perkinsus marinus ATCC 50983]|eukprot:XP_002780604.1 hypothetical protein Pmar_PMAR001197 [Perkinsus marinus ATCC 50983]
MAPLNDVSAAAMDCHQPSNETRTTWSPYHSLPSAVLLTIYSYDTVSEIFKRDLLLNKAVHSLLVDTLHIYDLVLGNDNRLIPWPERADALAGPGVTKSVTNDDDFWSSSGKAFMIDRHQNCPACLELPECVCDPEYLIYGLCDRSLITRVEINFYRADYQAGQPIYAPRAVRVFIRDGLDGEWKAVTAIIETKNTSKRLCIQ